MVKGDYCTGLTPTGIIRRLEVHSRPSSKGWMREALRQFPSLSQRLCSTLNRILSDDYVKSRKAQNIILSYYFYLRYTL